MVYLPMEKDDQTDPDEDQYKEDSASPPLWGAFFLALSFHEKFTPLESPAACPVRSSASIGACSGDEPRKTSGLLRGEDIIPFRANTGFNAPLALLETFSNRVNESPRWKVEDFLTGFTRRPKMNIQDLE